MKMEINYPTTISSRITEKQKKNLELMAKNSNKSKSEFIRDEIIKLLNK